MDEWQEPPMAIMFGPRLVELVDCSCFWHNWLVDCSWVDCS